MINSEKIDNDNINIFVFFPIFSTHHFYKHIDNNYGFKPHTICYSPILYIKLLSTLQQNFTILL